MTLAMVVYVCVYKLGCGAVPCHTAMVPMQNKSHHRHAQLLTFREAACKRSTEESEMQYIPLIFCYSEKYKLENNQTQNSGNKEKYTGTRKLWATRAVLCLGDETTKESVIKEICMVNPHYRAHSHTVLYMSSLMHTEYYNDTCPALCTECCCSIDCPETLQHTTGGLCL